jgi:signal transduction histidine kinase
MNAAHAFTTLRRRRPTLRFQIALLYAGVFLAVIAAVLVGTSVLFKTRNILFGRSQMRAPVGGGALARHATTVHQFDPGAAAIVLVITAVAFAAAWWLAGKFLRPLRTITATAQEISATNLHRRLSLDGPEDELTELGRTLDSLFARLEASFESQRHFVANASHELRTPLAGQRTLLQVALADPHADAERLRSTCIEALALGSQQERLIDALLTLASSERGLERSEPLNLAAVAESVLLSRRQEAERHGLQIQASLVPAPISGDAELIESMVANLLDNAIRHNLPGGTIDISTSVSGRQARISVRNTGPRVVAADLERIFQPFQRRTGARTSTTDGHGLGLAIIQAITRAHGAELTAIPGEAGGLEIVVAFPSGGEST